MSVNNAWRFAQTVRLFNEWFDFPNSGFKFVGNCSRRNALGTAVEAYKNLIP